MHNKRGGRDVRLALTRVTSGEFALPELCLTSYTRRRGCNKLYHTQRIRASRAIKLEGYEACHRTCHHGETRDDFGHKLMGRRRSIDRKVKKVIVGDQDEVVD